MKRIIRGGTALLSVALAIAQFIRPARNLGAAEGPGALVAVHAVPDSVHRILQRSCYDCHSDSTRYPWYAGVQPVGWWLQKHVNDGRVELNFSEFSKYSPKRAVRKLRAIADEVGDREMPLRSYLLVHRGARLGEAEIRQVMDWADALADEIESDGSPAQ